MRKPYSLNYSYEKGTADTQKQMKAEAKAMGIDLKPIHSGYVGHVAIKVSSRNLKKLKDFLWGVGLGKAVSLIEDGNGKWVAA